MRKIRILLLLFIFIALGCENIMNTPTSKVKSFISEYQNLNPKVVKELDNIISKNTELNKKEKEEYKKLLERQYQNLSYKIKDEDIEDNNATVLVEIEVFNYKDYLNIKKMKEIDEKIRYEITFYLYKENGIWKIEELNEEDLEKIHGLF